MFEWRLLHSTIMPALYTSSWFPQCICMFVAQWHCGVMVLCWVFASIWVYFIGVFMKSILSIGAFPIISLHCHRCPWCVCMFGVHNGIVAPWCLAHGYPIWRCTGVVRESTLCAWDLRYNVLPSRVLCLYVCLVCVASVLSHATLCSFCPFPVPAKLIKL